MNSGLGRIPKIPIRPVVLVANVVMLGISIRVTRLPFVLPQDGKAGFLRGKLRASLYLGFLVFMATPNGSRGAGDGIVGRDGFPSIENGFGLEAGQGRVGLVRGASFKDEEMDQHAEPRA